MQCPEFESRLDAILDERRDPAQDAAIVAHATFCEPCSELLEGQVTILHTLNRLKLAGLPVEKRTPRLSAALRPVLVVAAAMLLALGVLWQIRQRTGGIGDVARGDRPVIPFGNGAPALAMAARGRPMAEYRVLNGGGWLLEAPRLPHHLRAYRGTLGQLAISLPTALNRLDQVDQYAPGFNNLRASFDMIWHTLVPAFHGDGRDRSDAPDRQPTTDSRSLTLLCV